MKQNKTISLEMDTILKLHQEDNASALINRLLEDYFKEDKIADVLKETNELTNKIKDLEEKKETIETTNKKKEIIDKINLDPKIKAWFDQKMERPDILELDIFLTGHKINKTMNLTEYLNKWDEMDQARI